MCIMVGIITFEKQSTYLSKYVVIKEIENVE